MCNLNISQAYICSTTILRNHCSEIQPHWEKVYHPQNSLPGHKVKQLQSLQVKPRQHRCVLSYLQLRRYSGRRRDALFVHGMVCVAQQDVREARLQKVHGQERRLLHNLRQRKKPVRRRNQ